MIAPRAIATAILLACIGIVTIASIEPIAGNMIGQGMKDQGMIISCSPNMDCKAMMSINASMKQPFMTCMMMIIILDELMKEGRIRITVTMKRDIVSLISG